LLYRKYFDTRVNKEGAKEVKQPFKALDQYYANGDEDDPEYDRHEDANQQRPCYMVRPYSEEGKDEYEYKNIVYAKAPFHQVSTDKFKSRNLSGSKPNEGKKPYRQQYPEYGLVEGFPDGDRSRLFTEKTEVKYDSSKNNYPENQISQLLLRHQ
jgi:hypothetical protein